jgi:hypothetical protein
MFENLSSQNHRVRKAKLMNLFGRKRSQCAAPFIRKIIDLTTPNLTLSNDLRLSRRYNRCLPVAFSPWSKKGHDPERIGIGITSDLSDQGFAIITQGEMVSPELVVAFYIDGEMDEPWYFHATVRTNRCLLASFNLVGLEVVEFLNEQQRKKTLDFDQTVLGLLGAALHVS